MSQHNQTNAATATRQSIKLRILRTSDRWYLDNDGNWTPWARDARTWDHAPTAADRASQVQVAAGHAFFAEVEAVPS